MATFAGVDPKGGADPVLSHDHEPLDSFSGSLVLTGKDPKSAADPTVKSMPRRRKGDEPTLYGVNP